MLVYDIQFLKDYVFRLTTISFFILIAFYHSSLIFIFFTYF